MAWDPETYPATIRQEINDYDELQYQVAAATQGVSARNILDLGVGAGETARRVLHIHPDAHLVGIDSSDAMLQGAQLHLPAGRVTLMKQDLSAPLPDQRFELVVSALAIHHLEGEKKAALFAEISERLLPKGVFVMGDVVTPHDPATASIELEAGYDFPSTIDERLRWLTEAGLSAEITWARADLAVLRAVHAREPL